jgi:alpha-1,3-rhamnosyl/mannosyltransferase
LGIEKRVRFLGWVSEADLEGLYSPRCVSSSRRSLKGSDFLSSRRWSVVCRVACSNVSSLPEIAGDAASYFDPLQVDAIAGAMNELLTDRAKAEELARVGIERAKKFSWERVARETIATYERAVASR